MKKSFYITTYNGSFDKYDIIDINKSSQSGIIIHKSYTLGTDPFLDQMSNPLLVSQSLKVYPFRLSKYRFVNKIRVIAIMIMAYLKLI